MPSETRKKRSPITRSPRLAFALAAVVAGLLAAVPAANATTFCVGAPKDCLGTPMPGDGAGLQAALTLAGANNEDDVVRVGEGTYIAPSPAGFVAASPAHSIKLWGSGPETLLVGLGAHATTLSVTGTGGDSSIVQDVRIRLSAGGGSPTGLVLDDTGSDHVVVNAPESVSSGLGVRLLGHSGMNATRVITPGLTGVEADGNAEVIYSHVRAEVGVEAKFGVLLVADALIEASRLGIRNNAPTDVYNTLIHVRGGSATEAGILSSSVVTATHLTVAGAGDSTYGVRVNKLGGESASAGLSNTSVTGFEHDLSASADVLSHSTIWARHSNWVTAEELPGGEINLLVGNHSVAAPFVDPVGGDFHLRHDSPLVDAGGDFATLGDYDLDEMSRRANGDGTGGAEPDIGAYEYQRLAPTAAIAGPDAGTAGQALELSGAGSTDPDRGDALAYAWTFGDGAAASGPTAAHAFAAPGSYTVTLVVTDPTGLQATASKLVIVEPSAAGETPPDGSGADTVAPVIGRLQTARRGKAIRFRLSEPAQVTLRLGRVGSRRFAGRIRLSGRSGVNVVPIPRRLARALGPGRYRVKATARDAVGNLARPRVARLVLLRRAA
jgi:hypothetical protein